MDTQELALRRRTPKRPARRRKLPNRNGSGSYLKKTDPAVRAHFAGAVDLPTFLARAGALTLDERKRLVRQALILIEQNYAHLPLKRAMHAVDPVQRLRLLLRRLDFATPDTLPPETEFHREMTSIFTSLRDLHTNYLLPAPFASMTAFLPFMIEDFEHEGTRRYIVSHTASGFTHPDFVPGVEVVHWNGMPIERAIAVQARLYAGSNPEAQHARAVQTITTRALRVSAPPDEDWVIVEYRALDGEAKELRFDWMVNPPLPSDQDADGLAMNAAVGLDLEQHLVQLTRKALFAPEAVAAERERKARTTARGSLASAMPTVFQAREVDTPSGKFGYLRIRTFNVTDVDGFVNEYLRLVAALPQGGLIIDVRGNGGGVIMNGELILQTLTPRRIEPEPVQFLNTPLNLQICERNGPAPAIVDLTPWVESMRLALQTGATFSAGFSITDANDCNRIGQRYFGPVVLITDALCYSTTDIFAAGFQDHEIGPILGVDRTTGAGGANVWTHDLLRKLVPDDVSQYEVLPNGAGMRVSIRRTLRVGRRSGTPVEDLGVLADHRHPLTRNDLLNGNVDLINHAASLLAGRPVRTLSVRVRRPTGGPRTVTVKSSGMDRLDFYLDDRPIASKDVTTATTALPLDDKAVGTIEIRGFANQEPVARYREVL